MGAMVSGGAYAVCDSRGVEWRGAELFARCHVHKIGCWVGWGLLLN